MMLTTFPVATHATTSPAQGDNPHFQRIGGEEAIARLVERFYAHMDALPEAATIRRMHAADLGETKRVLRLYFAEWMGGPAAYSAERGHPRLRMRHARVAIDASARDAWMSCMRAALGEVVPDEAFRAELEQTFFKLADFLQNAPAASAGSTR